MKVAIIGTVGVPACYGGFETLAENLVGEYCAPDVEYTVFCSSKAYKEKLDRYKNAKLKYIPLRANDIQCIPFDAISLLRSMRDYDVILYLGVCIPLFSLLKKFCKGKIVANIDGLDQERDKFNWLKKTYLNFLTKNKILAPDIVIADNKGIQDFAKDKYGKDTIMIPYGGDQVLRELSDAEQQKILDKYNLKRGQYAVSVCRIEPENNCHITLEACKQTGMPIIFIGNWDRSEYGRNLKSEYSECPNIHIQDPIYDLDTLYALRKNAGVYIHGHKVGGTNPSLVEAMFFGIPILCYDVIYNRETTYNKAGYYNDVESLKTLLKNYEDNGAEMRRLADRHYTWKKIVKDYEDTYRLALSKG